jgi:hypothetical protein
VATIHGMYAGRHGGYSLHRIFFRGFAELSPFINPSYFLFFSNSMMINPSSSPFIFFSISIFQWCLVFDEGKMGSAKYH